ncbi:hypothetical protein [Rubellicoccus peritrichatus]|uniref:PEP-CTERM protein-sorting domain-containing protein n=1 Tax=Rubellicoccus peritrichatus TaxID=3080537 RepID=A0AAQ3QVX6_9BACT|nr:hypothetical protein [Puniceicoccus sp. CR14]WOO41355.1 hypothetical protein RZN69_22275 [Puniceicoccus sp. CR14]
MKTIVLLAATQLAVGAVFALTASDNASNYGGGWTNGSNQGTGFGTWSLNSDGGTSGFAGNFLGDSTAGAGDINTAGNSFGLFANQDAGAFSTATRSFSSALTTNDQFTAQIALNFDNGNKGFNLRTGTDNILGFNVGSGGSINTAFTDNPITAQYDYGGNDAVIDISILVTSASSVQYTVSRTSSAGLQGILFNGSITGIAGSIDNFEFYNSGTDNGDPQNNLYFNSIAVNPVPEPSFYAALGGIVALGIALLRRQRS